MKLVCRNSPQLGAKSATEGSEDKGGGQGGHAHEYSELTANTAGILIHFCVLFSQRHTSTFIFSRATSASVGYEDKELSSFLPAIRNKLILRALFF